MIFAWFLLHRPKWEGGEYEGDDDSRFEALLLAMELGAEYVDVELKVGSFPIFHFIKSINFFTAIFFCTAVLCGLLSKDKPKSIGSHLSTCLVIPIIHGSDEIEKNFRRTLT